MPSADVDQVSLEASRGDDGRRRVRILGAARLDDVAQILSRIEQECRDAEAVTVDLSAANHADASVVASLVRWRREAVGRDLVVGRDLTPLVDLFDDHAPGELPERPRSSFLERVGRAVEEGGQEARAALAFVGELISTCARALRRPRLIRWRQIPSLIERIGADGLFIVCLMSGLVGLVTGYQGAVQLQRFGAGAYTANLVGLANVRELAPLMTAIIVTGRSGAGFAAELGTMRVSEEVDALRTLGFSSHGFLVLPRCIALLVAVPVLTLIADVAAVAGALLVALVMLDTTSTAFLFRTRAAVDLADVGSGLIKGAAFAVAIGLTACHLGLRASGGARGVGERTTSTVVVVLVLLVVIDAVLTVVMHQVGLW